MALTALCRKDCKGTKLLGNREPTRDLNLGKQTHPSACDRATSLSWVSAESQQVPCSPVEAPGALGLHPKLPRLLGSPQGLCVHTTHTGRETPEYMSVPSWGAALSREPEPRVPCALLLPRGNLGLPRPLPQLPLVLRFPGGVSEPRQLQVGGRF